jgi:hypothetical protein
MKEISGKLKPGDYGGCSSASCQKSFLEMCIVMCKTHVSGQNHGQFRLMHCCKLFKPWRWSALFTVLRKEEIVIDNSFNIVAYRPVAKRWFCKQRPLLWSARNIHACNNRRTVFSEVRAAVVSRQQLGKHVPAVTNTQTTIVLLLETVFSTRSEQTGYKEDSWGDPVSCELSCTREAEKRWCYSSVDNSVLGYSSDSNDVSTEAEKSPLFRPVTK